MIDFHIVLYAVHVDVWNQAILELSGGAQENLSSSQLVELRFESLTMHVTREFNTDDNSKYIRWSQQ